MKNQIAILLCTLLAFVSAVKAQEPENYIKYRQAIMNAIGGHSGAASQILRDKVPEATQLSMHAKALADLTADLTRLFPEGSDFGETRAKAEIWDNWEKFQKAASAATSATAAFAEAVAQGNKDSISAAFKDVGEACKSCHKEFREKDE